MNRMTTVCAAAALAVSVTTFAPNTATAQETPAPATTAAESPATGFSLTGRLGMVNTAGAEGILGGLGAPAPLSLGYDTGSFTIGIGPAYHSVAVSFDDVDPSSIGMVGANVLATFVVSEAAGGNLQLYPLVGLGSAVGFSSEDTGIEDSFFLQIEAGLGMRYFLNPNVAAHVEFGEGLNRLTVNDDFGTTTTTVLTTWGNLGLAIIFG